MVKRKTRSTSLKTVKASVEGMEKKKGHDICYIDLRKIPSAVCDYFVICHGNSKPQIDALTRAVEETILKKTGLKPWHREGMENAQWIVLDYMDVVVHIMHREMREYYKLEELWADAEKREVGTAPVPKR